MRRMLLLLSIVVGCGSKEPANPCGQLGDAAKYLAAEWAAAHHLPGSTVDLSVTLDAKCRSDRWPLRDVRCITAPAACADPAPHARALAFVDSILTTHPVGSNAALAEVGPHPDYPTPVSAGTASIFLLEEPDRGPPAPAKYTPPSRGSLSWKMFGYCEFDPLGPTCSEGTDATPWRVGRSGTRIVVEHLAGTHVLETTIYELSPRSAPVQTVVLDARGRVSSAARFTGPKYSLRLRNGANGLEGCGVMGFATNTQNRLGERSCEQWTGGTMLDTRGVAIYRYTRDAAGFISVETRFDTAASPLAGNDGVHKIAHERDARGRPTVDRYFDVAGDRVSDLDGCAGERAEYDSDGAATRFTCLDAADHPTGRAADGIATRELTYDGRGCLIGTRSLSSKGTPVVDLDGIAGEDLLTDAYCTQTRRTCVDLRGDPHACGPGKPAQTRFKLDAVGNAIATTHYNQQEQAAVDPEFDAFEIRTQFDAVGNEVSTSCYDAAGRAIDCDGTGFHEKRRTFDANGRQLDETFFDVRNNRATNLGARSRHYKYDNYDHAYESQSFDAAGKLVEQMGVATVRQLYDLRHQRFAVVLLDVSGAPAQYTACFTGATCPDKPWHAVRIVRLGDGTLDYNQFFDADGQLIEAISCRTDKCFD